MSKIRWNKFSIASLPPTEFVLVYVEFDGPDNPRAMPQILRAYYSYHDGYWRTTYGRLQGRVTHWMLLPPAPVVEQELRP